jgi:hypothetical protein
MLKQKAEAKEAKKQIAKKQIAKEAKMPKTAAPKRKSPAQMKKEMIQRNLPNFIIEADTTPSKRGQGKQSNLKEKFFWGIKSAFDGRMVSMGGAFTADAALKAANKWAAKFAAGEMDSYNEKGEPSAATLRIYAAIAANH